MVFWVLEDSTVNNSFVADSWHYTIQLSLIFLSWFVLYCSFVKKRLKFSNLMYFVYRNSLEMKNACIRYRSLIFLIKPQLNFKPIAYPAIHWVALIPSSAKQCNSGMQICTGAICNARCKMQMPFSDDASTRNHSISIVECNCMNA